MTRLTSRQKALARERAEARSTVITKIREIVGTAATTETVETLLQQARARGPQVIRTLARHFEQHPDALTAPSASSPAVLARLLKMLDAAGYGDAVTLIRCARCDRTDRELKRRTPEGLCCGWCINRARVVRCARCGRDGFPQARRPEGVICRNCYDKDPEVVIECAGCGRHRRCHSYRDDGAGVCQACEVKPKRECAGCGRSRAVQANTPAGPVCRTCYRSPARLCGNCGEIKPILKRATGNEPDTCYQCYSNRGECVVCGRFTSGAKYKGKDFHCGSCWPHLPRACADCERTRRVKVVWPVGDLCDTCYHRRRRHPQPCGQCGINQVMVGRSDDGRDLCGPCSGIDITYACQRCGHPGDIYKEGCCTRCVLGDRVHQLLSDDHGTLAPHLRPLAETLKNAEHPYSVIRWLRHHPATSLLARLASENTHMTHELLDSLPQDHATDYTRGLLVASGLLPERNEHFAQLQLWANQTLNELPAKQLRIIRPFAEWSILRDARRRAQRRRYTSSAASGDRSDIRTAVQFLSWLDTNTITYDDVRQEHLDTWLDAHPTRRRSLIAFIRWTTARRITPPLDLPAMKHTLPSHFLPEQEHHEQLRRCLNDDSLPREVRIIGALIRLYALPVARIVELTTNRFHRDERGAYLILDRNPVLLPPKLAQLIEQQTTDPRRFGMLDQPAEEQPMFPGKPLNKPRSAGGTQNLMREYGFLSLSARNTAMIEAATALPPIVISDLFGIHPHTANAWATYAQDSWADYLAARAQE